MAETAQDVFDELWKRYELVCSDLELEIGQGCPRGLRGLSGYDMTIRQRFAKAVSQEKGSKSTPLTEKQKKCPYCHISEEADSPSWIKGTGERIDGARFYISVGHPGHAIILDDEHEWLGISIRYCPMCGRRLEEE